MSNETEAKSVDAIANADCAEAATDSQVVAESEASENRESESTEEVESVDAVVRAQCITMSPQ